MKLYVLVRRDLSTSQQAVQSGHAIYEFAKKHPEIEHGSLVLLGVTNKLHLGQCLETIVEKKVEYATFLEPYWDDELTAFAVVGTPEIQETFKDLRLL